MKWPWRKAPERFATFEEVFGEELDLVSKPRQVVRDNEEANQKNEATADEEDDVYSRAHRANLMGLAFSGGGIRSATFNLGILQGMANWNLLGKCHYLSTVSGGGYIGSWLSAWIKKDGLETVQERLHPVRTSRQKNQPKDFREEPHAIHFLRDYSNYLTPRKGLLGADTWASFSIYVRNLLLNLTILVAALTAVLLLPRALVWSVMGVPRSVWVQEFPGSALGLTVALLVVAIYFIARNLASGQKSHWFTQQLSILCVVVAPLLCAACMLAMWLWFNPKVWKMPWLDWAVLGGVFYLSLWLLGWFLNLTLAPIFDHTLDSLMDRIRDRKSNYEKNRQSATRDIQLESRNPRRTDEAQQGSSGHVSQSAHPGEGKSWWGVGMAYGQRAYRTTREVVGKGWSWRSVIFFAFLAGAVGGTLLWSLQYLYGQWNKSAIPWHVISWGTPLMTWEGCSICRFGFSGGF